MRIFTMLQSLQRLQLTTSLSATTTIIVKGTVSALMRNIVSLVLISMMMMMLMSENRTTTTTTTTIGPQWMAQAMMASPHTYLADQNEDTITLKIKGDEQENWVTDMDGKEKSKYIELHSQYRYLYKTCRDVCSYFHFGPPCINIIDSLTTHTHISTDVVS